MKAALRTFLLADSDIDAAVNDVFAAGTVPQGTARPYITLQRITGYSERHLEGLNGVARELWQLDVWADTESEAESIKEDIRLRMDQYAGSMSTFTVYGIILSDVRDSTERVTDGSEDVLSRRSIDFRIGRSEDAAAATATATATATA